MNLSRGFFRLWLVASLVWYASFAAVLARDYFECLSPGLKLASCYQIVGLPPVGACAFIILWPFILIAAGLTGRWIRRGFR